MVKMFALHCIDRFRVLIFYFMTEIIFHLRTAIHVRAQTRKRTFHFMRPNARRITK